MFIGREKELALLQQDYIGKAAMVYGKRRVGKTTLIQKALKSSSYRTVYFECLKGTMQDNISGFVQELVRAKILPVPLNFGTLQDVFAYLNALPEKIVVVIDEYPYLKAMNDSATVDSIFQNIIDNRLVNIELILSGSHIGMMKDALQEKNALYGRFAVTIKLNELNYLEAAKFYPDKTPYDKAAHYAVFGGSPFVNQALQPTATIRENIISTILNPMSAVYLYASQLLLSDYSVKINAERIFSVIGNGKKRYTEIEDKLDKYGYAVASLLKGENDYGQMTIGSVARCVCCGGEQKNHRSIRCAECGNMYVCKGCGKTVHGYGRYIDEHFYCNECSYECAVCKEKFIGMPRIGIARSGEQRGICPACYEQVVGVCRNCTIHGDCLSIGANRFCPNQMSGLAA